MVRIVKHEEKGPMEVKVKGESKWICMCGLTKNKPFCDGSHKQCSGEEEGKLYEYENGKRVEIKSLVDVSDFHNQKKILNSKKAPPKTL